MGYVFVSKTIVRFKFYPPPFEMTIFLKDQEQPGPPGNMYDTPGLKENIIHGKSQAWNDKEVKCNFTDWWKQKV